MSSWRSMVKPDEAIPTLVPCVDEKSRVQQTIERAQPMLPMGWGNISQSYARILRGMTHRGAVSPGRVDRGTPRCPRTGCEQALWPGGHRALDAWQSGCA